MATTLDHLAHAQWVCEQIGRSHVRQIAAAAAVERMERERRLLEKALARLRPVVMSPEDSFLALFGRHAELHPGLFPPPSTRKPKRVKPADRFPSWPHIGGNDDY